MSNPQHIARAHALARILGWLYTDRAVSYRTDRNSFEGALFLGHSIDAAQAAKDVTLVLGHCSAVQQPTESSNYFKVRINK